MKSITNENHEALLKRREELNATIKAAKEEALEIEKEIVRRLSPFAVGDKITWSSSGYRNVKEYRGTITRILPCMGSYRLVARRERKDGTLGAEVDIYSWHKPQKFTP